MAKKDTLSPEDREAQREARRAERARSWGQIVYALRLLVLLVALGLTIWVYGGDVYVAGTLIVCGLGVFAAGIAPGLIPDLIRNLVLMPFVLGTLIPLWRLLDALFRWERPPIINAAVVLGVYAIAVLMLMRLPTRMRAPFISWMPKGAIPDEEAEALRKQAREREAAERKAERLREKQAARAAQKREKASESGGKKRFGRGKAAPDAQPATAATGSKSNPFFSSSSSSPAPAEDKDSGGGKKRFGWGRGKSDPDAQPATTATSGKSNPFFSSSTSSPAPAEDKDSGGGKKRFGWGRGKSDPDAQPATAATSGKSNPFFSSSTSSPAPAEDKDSEGGKKRFGWGRGKTAESDAGDKPPEKSAPAYGSTPAPSSTSPFFFEDDLEDEDSETQGGYNWQNRYGTPSNVGAFHMDDDEDDPYGMNASDRFNNPSISSDEETDELIEKIRAMRRKQKGL